ncbi:cystathionine gamma-synthase [candidate division BRC1 bacterium SM23_51]|nr:MAG: cystathionine gamma-synthase [candidate division BRC1 bacterium SM23_51]
MKPDEPIKFGTKIVHAGEPHIGFQGELIPPITQSALFVFKDQTEVMRYVRDEEKRYEYGRYGTPIQTALEGKMAAIEGAEESLLFASGMSAITTTLLCLLSKGDHLILVDDVYKRTRYFATATLVRFGIESTLVNPSDTKAMIAAMRPNTKIFFAESPTNPHLGVIDLPPLVEACRNRGVLLIIDSTLATPINQRPIEFGADLVLHSLTKYLAGHNDVMGGIISGRSELISRVRDFRGETGGTADPHQAYLVLRGLKTLQLRVERSNATGLAVARFLEQHPKVERVFYPGLESSPYHAIASRQMTGFGGLVSFWVKGGEAEAFRVIDSLRIPRNGPSLGGVESLVCHPPTLTYYKAGPAERKRLGIRDTLIRYAVGLEDAEDLIADLDQALAKI